MAFPFPTTAYELLVMIVPVITLLLGLAFLIFPGRLLKFSGLQANASNPEAIGEGRSSFAGVLLAVALGCLLLQDPIALQPGLNFMLALGWTIAALGRLIHIALDGDRRKSVQVRFALALVLAVVAWVVADVPSFKCVNPLAANCDLVLDWRNGLVSAAALLTLGLGLMALLMPNLALLIMKLQTVSNVPNAIGETRGILAGFYTSIGLTNLLSPQPADFVAIVLGAAWLLTGCGRVISILLDRGWTKYNLFGALFELGLGVCILGIIFRMI